ncbi:MAG TPA: cobalamin-dependent protein [Candidatus Nanoarchaeia archaeon]|nr:cobalamin-dependent protein [Candidatus Nanoarchaeia archaeon]
MKITLICPTNYYGTSATSGIYYPMGILAVGTRLRQAFPDAEVAVIDGEIDSRPLEELIRGSDVVGFSANTNNYPHVKEGARIAKEQGISVVVGGPHASAVIRHQGGRMPMAENILRNDPNIDAVVVYDGDEAFVRYVEERQKKHPHYEAIANLFWRTPDGEIQENVAVLPTSPPLLAETDFSLMNLGRYWREHEKEYPEMSGEYMQGFTHVGCSWRDKSGGCAHCDISYPRNVYVSPKVFWDDLQKVQERFGVKSFKDYGDCLTGNPKAVWDLLAARPSSMEAVEFSCYGRSSEITDEMADMLQALNVKYVYIGLDSGSTRMLKNMNKGMLRGILWTP